MRLIACLLAALAAACAVSAAGQDVWQQDNRPAPDDRSQAARDGFGTMMLVTADAEAFWRAWEGPTPPNLPTTGHAERGRQVNGMIIFFGCAAGRDGNCNVTAAFSFLRPDGSPYGDTLQGEIWRQQPAPGSNLQLGVGSAGLVVEPEDPMGVWTIRAVVTDNVRGLSLTIERQVTVDTPPEAVPRT